MYSELTTEHVGTLACVVLSVGANLSLLYILLKSKLFSYPRAYLEALSDAKRISSGLTDFLRCGYCLGTWTFLAIWIFLVWFNNSPVGWAFRIFGLLAGLGFHYLAWAVLLHTRPTA